MASVEIERLVRLLARLPGLGQRSAQRAALAMLKRRDTLMLPLAEAMAACAELVHPCAICGNLDTPRALRHLPRPRARRRGWSASWPSSRICGRWSARAASSPAATTCSAAR